MNINLNKNVFKMNKQIINTVLESLIIFLLCIDLIITKKKNNKLIETLENSQLITLPSIQIIDNEIQKDNAIREATLSLKDGELTTATIEIDVSEKK